MMRRIPMEETWEQTKHRFEKQGISLSSTSKKTKVRYNTSEIEAIILDPLYEVRRITLPVNKAYEHGKVVLYGVTAQEADWWLDNRFKPKVYIDDETNVKTLVFYEKFPINGTPSEKSIYANPEKFCLEEIA